MAEILQQEEFKKHKEKIIKSIDMEHKSLFGFGLQDVLKKDMSESEDYKELAQLLVLQILSFADKVRTLK